MLKKTKKKKQIDRQEGRSKIRFGDENHVDVLPGTSIRVRNSESHISFSTVKLFQSDGERNSSLELIYICFPPQR